jgi:hypothetical protein
VVISRLLTLPLASLALKVLELQHFAPLLEFLPWRNRKAVAVTLVRAVLDTRSRLTDMGSIQKLLAMIVPMIREEPVGMVAAEGGGEGPEGKEATGKAGGEEEGGSEEAPATTLEEEQVRWLGPQEKDDDLFSSSIYIYIHSSLTTNRCHPTSSTAPACPPGARHGRARRRHGPAVQVPLPGPAVPDGGRARAHHLHPAAPGVRHAAPGSASAQGENDTGREEGEGRTGRSSWCSCNANL